MWLWANVHGTFSLGFLYLGVVLVATGSTTSRLRRGDSALLFGTTIAAVVVFVNPYGPKLVFSRSRSGVATAC